MKLVTFPEKRLALAFSDYLRSIGIASHLEHSGEGIGIVLESHQDFLPARAELDIFLATPDHPKYWQASWQSGQAQAEPVYKGSGMSAISGWWRRAGILTRVVTLLCLLVFAGLNLLPDIVFGILRYPAIDALPDMGLQWWRLLTPALMHFSVMHIAFNLLWWWELGALRH